MILGGRPARRGRAGLLARPTRRCTAARRSPALVGARGAHGAVDPVVAASGGLVGRDQPHARLRGRLRGRDRGRAARSRAAGRRCCTACCSRSRSCACTGSRRRSRPGWLAEDEIYARLREPYGYWNAVGVTAAMGDPALPVARHARRGRRWSNGARLSAARPADRDDAAELLARQHHRRRRRASRCGSRSCRCGCDARRAAARRARRAALVTAWAFGQSALTDDRVALAEREDAGIEFGLILLGMALAAVRRRPADRAARARRSRCRERTRRTLGQARARLAGRRAADRAGRPRVQRPRDRRHGLGPLGRPHQRGADAAERSRAG